MSYLLKELSHEILRKIAPKEATWVEGLRFYCQTSEPNDPSLDFMASMWSYAIAHGELTGKQAESAHKYLAARFYEIPPDIARYLLKDTKY